MHKVKPKLINVSEHPTFVVGQNPGHRRDGSAAEYAWEGNRSARCIQEITDGLDNLYLTNATNWTVMNSRTMLEGTRDLIDAILDYWPVNIICLGTFAASSVTSITRAHGLDESINVVQFHHPSYVLRFNKGIEAYKHAVRAALEQGGRL